jgi:hypothetical protein
LALAPPSVCGEVSAGLTHPRKCSMSDLLSCGRLMSDFSAQCLRRPALARSRATHLPVSPLSAASGGGH